MFEVFYHGIKVSAFVIPISHFGMLQNAMDQVI